MWLDLVLQSCQSSCVFCAIRQIASGGWYCSRQICSKRRAQTSDDECEAGHLGYTKGKEAAVMRVSDLSRYVKVAMELPTRSKAECCPAPMPLVSRDAQSATNTPTAQHEITRLPCPIYLPAPCRYDRMTESTQTPSKPLHLWNSYPAQNRSADEEADDTDSCLHTTSSPRRSRSTLSRDGRSGC